MLYLEQPRRSKFRAILVGSALLHVAFLAIAYGSWMWGVALKFGSIQWDDGGEAKHVEKVAMLDRTKPLYVPPGFYAVEKPPEKVVERDEPKTEKPQPKKDEKKAKKDEPDDVDREGDETAKNEDEEKKDEKPDQPAGNLTFGTIRGTALKPHIVQVYTAYEKGLIDATSFTVAVTCKAERDGSLSNIKIVKSSNNELIDQAAINLFRELGDMHALAPLSILSSISLTLDVGPTSSSLTAAGFATDPGVSQDLATQLNAIKTFASFRARTDDEKALLKSIDVSQSANRVTVRVALPNSRASDMMHRNFGGTDTARASS
jgi:hypothetical protein